jgi:hypothetical protein
MSGHGMPIRKQGQVVDSGNLIVKFEVSSIQNLRLCGLRLYDGLTCHDAVICIDIPVRHTAISRLDIWIRDISHSAKPNVYPNG